MNRVHPVLLVTLLTAFAGDGGPSFEGVAWVDAAPELKGKVAIVRWWTQG